MLNKPEEAMTIASVELMNSPVAEVALKAFWVVVILVIVWCVIAAFSTDNSD